jgi:hypothetical protein
MSAYIRSKVTNINTTDVTIQVDGSTAKLRQDGSFKLPYASSSGGDSPAGSIRYNDTTGKLEFRDSTDIWRVIDAITDGVATITYVDNAINGLADVARTGDFSDLINVPNFVTPAVLQNKIDELVGTAPGLLDTLNEIAQAIGNDPQFSNTVVAQLSNKLSLTGGTLTGALILNSDPVLPLQAATKEYVDNATSGVTVNSSDDVPEGDVHLYFTTARARSAISAGNGISYNSNTGVVSISSGSNVTFGTVVADTFVSTNTGVPTFTSANNILLDAAGEVVLNSPITLKSYHTSQLAGLVVDKGTLVFDSATNEPVFWNGTNWISFSLIDSTGVVGDNIDGGVF